MEYEWDERKRLRNLEQHGLDFRDAWQVYEAPCKITLHSPHSRESRWVDLAEVKGHVWWLVYTHREKRVRIISFRLAKRKHRRWYYEQRQTHDLPH